jgi:hypothetical protein
MNQLSKGPTQVGDILADGFPLLKYWKFRVGPGGTAVGTSEVAMTVASGRSPNAPALPAQAVVADVFVNVLAASTGTTKTLSVGLLSTSSGGAVAGFLSGISVGTTGLQRPTFTAATSGPGSGGRFYSANTWGSFLSVFQAGSTAAGDPGVALRQSFVSDSVTAKTLSFTPGSSDFVALTVDVYLGFADLTR